MQSRISSLTLTDFRSYERAELETDGGSVFLFGPNGAGKTNLLEAISLLSPGRGLRGSPLSEVGRRVSGDEGETRIGTGSDTAGALRRAVRIDGETTPPGRMADHVRPIWLTPAQDRLFLDGAGERRRFFDRLVFAAEAAHAVHATAYDRANRERMRLLSADEAADPAWLSALEARMAESGALMAEARARTLRDLQAEIDSRGERPFPQAALRLTGEWEALAAAGLEFAEIEARLAGALAGARERDAAAGRALTGPHRGDLAVVHRERDRPAGECSTGEQKALRLSRAESQPNPILLLDEVAAHLDPVRRAALFDEIEALSLQAFLTGTDEALFDHLKGRAVGVLVDASRLTVLDPLND